ncbi:unnamed protein product [Ranitomeya imitator]|uniref:Major facilitator superfamily (MFS) profile domain-containing protein n=1 Tax=Ranitomeya imitator TaxID=111125 RepID=A0ABN9L9D0_9NEOB|nr:unnamed protein product [Ranitomeya imitator]
MVLKGHDGTVPVYSAIMRKIPRGNVALYFLQHVNSLCEFRSILHLLLNRNPALKRRWNPHKKRRKSAGNPQTCICSSENINLWFSSILQGFLSFMCAPLIGALSDVYGRKSFLLITVFFTCAPIPLMRISPWWYFAMISVSGAFSVTFSVIFAYVADITQEHERSTAYGLVSATFAASLVTSPAIGAYISTFYGDNLVVLLATVVALLDICFILLVVPESLRDKMRPNFWGAQISWEQADPFSSLKKIGKDTTVLLICITVFFSYLPEAGQYSSFFLYLKQIIGFNQGSIAAFIAVVGILSIVAQTVFLSILMRSIGNKNTVLLGLGFQMFQLAWYGFGSQPWMMWAAGAVAAMSSITFPAVSALISRNAESDQQGFYVRRASKFLQMTLLERSEH